MKKSERARWIRMAIAALPLALGVWIGGTGGCVVVECVEGEIACHGDFVEECYQDEWVVVDDCFDYCGGTCIEDDLVGPACLC